LTKATNWSIAETSGTGFAVNKMLDALRTRSSALETRTSAFAKALKRGRLPTG
jgi:hypothetical protein